MKPETIAALGSSRAVVVAVVIAAAALALLALIGAAKLMGWSPSKPVIPGPGGKAASGAPAAGTAPDVVLAPGETLVVPVEKPPAPMMPHYTAPQAPAPAPASREPETTSPPPVPATPVERPKPKPSPRPEPRTPNFARGDPHPTSPLDTWPNPAPAAGRCAHCGQVVVVTVWPDIAEVRVRFEDGSVRTLRSPVPSRWHVGDRVRLERGRLVPD